MKKLHCLHFQDHFQTADNPNLLTKVSKNCKLFKASDLTSIPLYGQVFGNLISKQFFDSMGTFELQSFTALNFQRLMPSTLGASLKLLQQSFHEFEILISGQFPLNLAVVKNFLIF